MQFTPAPATLLPGRRIYAIGDVHGCDQPLAALHAMIMDDLVRRPVASPLLIHIGDYVDRGPASAAVVERLAAGAPIPGVPVVNLIGNHEETMLHALAGDGAAATDWLYTGGREALESWGIDPASPRASWRDGIPPHHLAFLQRLTLSHREADYLFVHAGIRPGVPLDRQTRLDLLCIRAPFLFNDSALGVVVVHGHSPTSRPVGKPNRVGIDTGAVFGGKLTCAVLEDKTIGFMQA